MDEDKRRKIIATDTRARAVFAALAVVVPLALGLLFRRQELRLRALATHGRTATATLTEVTRQGSDLSSHYRYEVDGAVYTWSVDWKEAPFAPDETFAVTYLPKDPSLSRPGASYTQERLLEELDLPLQRGLLLGIFVFCGAAAALCHRNVLRLREGAALRTKPWLSPDGAGRLIASLLLGCMLAVNLDPKVHAVQVAAFGAAPLGLPVGPVVSFALIVLFAPYFWVFPHLMCIVVDHKARGGSLSKAGILLAVARAGPAWRRSRTIVIAGFVYFVVLLAAWIAFTASRGI